MAAREPQALNPRTASLDRFGAVWGRSAVIGVPMLFLLAVFLLPFLVVFKISVSEMDTVFFHDVLV